MILQCLSQAPSYTCNFACSGAGAATTCGTSRAARRRPPTAALLVRCRAISTSATRAPSSARRISTAAVSERRSPLVLLSADDP